MTPSKRSSAPIGSWIGTGLAPSRSRISVDRGGEVGADAIHLVDEAIRGTWNLSACRQTVSDCGSTPDDAVEHHDRAVEHPQAALDLDGEVDVAGGVDEVDVVVAPGEAGRGGGDGDAALALLGHPVHLRLAFVDLAHLVDASRVEEEAFADRRLAGVDVRDDADVAHAGHLRAGGFDRGRPSAA